MSDRKKPEAVVVEIEPSGLTWRKSSASGSGGDGCLEFALIGQLVGVRTSRNRRGLGLRLAAPSWRSLIDYASRRQPSSVI